MWSTSLITPPVAEPLDLTTEVYPHLRLDESLSPQNELIAARVQGSREKCESFTQRQLITATWELWLDRWCEQSHYRHEKLFLPYPPLQPQSGTPTTAGVLSVTYVDQAGIVQELEPERYVVVAPQGPRAGQGYIALAYGEYWPSVRCQPGAIKVRYTAGYGATYDKVPAGLRNGMLLIVGSLDALREEQTTGTVLFANVIRAEGLWSPFREW